MTEMEANFDTGHLDTSVKLFTSKIARCAYGTYDYTHMQASSISSLLHRQQRLAGRAVSALCFP